MAFCGENVRKEEKKNINNDGWDVYTVQFLFHFQVNFNRSINLMEILLPYMIMRNA